MYVEKNLYERQRLNGYIRDNADGVKYSKREFHLKKYRESKL